MNSRFGLAAITLALLGISLAAAAPEPPRLAVLSANPDLASSADLLATRLSGQDGVTLVERAEMTKVLAEQRLAAIQQQDVIKLGRLLNADGLLWLESMVADNKAILAVRLVAMKPGISLAEHRFALPLPKPDEWAGAYAARLQPLLPKLTIRPESAIPISLLNLRSSMATIDGRNLERELTALLQFRLIREPGLFVLERRRMEELQLEKNLGVDREPFWNGAYVVDGTLNRDEVGRDAVTLHARVTPPNGGAVSLELTGHRNNLPAIADDLALKVLATIGVSTQTTAASRATWSSEAEAKEYAREAAWAWQWGLLREAAEASDASWILGEHSANVAALRVLSRAWQGMSMRGPLPYQGTGPYGFRPPPSPTGLVLLTRALEIYCELFPALAGRAKDPAVAWGSVGLDTLLAASRVLDRYQENVEFTQGYESDLRQLRALAREANMLLTTHPLLGPVNWRRDLKELPGIPVNLTVRQDAAGMSGVRWPLSGVWFNAGGTWFETPEDAVAMYQRLLAPEAYGQTRNSLLNVKAPLVAWNVGDQQRLPAVWAGFLKSMAAATNEQMRLDGLRLLLGFSTDPDALERSARTFLEEAWRMRLGIFTGKIEAPVELVFSNLTRRVEPWGRPAVEPLRSMKEFWTQRFAEAAPDLSYEAWKELLVLMTSNVSRGYAFEIPAAAPRPEQARELLKLFDSLNAESMRRFVRTKQFLDHLKAAAGLTNASADVLPARISTQVPVQPVRTATLRVSGRWSSKEARLPAGRMLAWNGLVRNLVWHENHVWMEASTRNEDENNQRMKPALLRWNPTTQHTDLIEAPFEAITSPHAHRRSLLVGDEIFFCADDALWERDGGRQWRRLPLPVSSGGIPHWWNNRVVLSARNAILEVHPKSQETRLLASARRNPPVTALDRASGMWEAPMEVWPDGQLCVQVDGKIWSFDAAKQDWSAVHTATNCGEHLQLHTHGALYRQTTECGPGLLGGWLAGASQLEHYTSTTESMSRRTTDWPTFTPTLWIAPTNIHPHGWSAAVSGPNVWVFPLRVLGDAAPTPTPTGPSISVVYFDRRFPRGMILSLEFSPRDASLASTLSAASAALQRGAEIAATPAGLTLLFRDAGVVLWFSPGDVKAAVEDALRMDPQQERPELAQIRPFDRNGNGWLEDDESLIRQRDTGWQQQERQRFTQLRREAMDREGSRWKELFPALDTDRDGLLSRFELRVARSTQPGFFEHRVRGVNGSFSQALLPFDVNGDASLTLDEFMDFAADPRPLAVVNQSVGWVARFGLEPGQCDLDGNGRLDLPEWKRVNDLIRERLKAVRLPGAPSP